MLGTFHFFAEKWRNVFQFSSIPTEYRHGPYKRRLKSCFKGWSLVRPSMSLRHMHHCMSMNALEQGLLGLEAAKASHIDDFVRRKTMNALCQVLCVACPSEGWRRGAR